MRNVTSLMSYGKKPWVRLIGVIGYVSYALALVAICWGLKRSCCANARKHLVGLEIFIANKTRK